MDNEVLKRITDLENKLKMLESSSTIPLPVDRAFRERLRSVVGLKTSSKSATSENQAVNESGSASYSVLGTPNGFDERTDNGIVKYYPYYT